MRLLTIGHMFSLPMPLYDLFLYGGALLTFLSIGMLLSGRLKGRKCRKVWPVILIAGVLMLVPILLSMIYGLGEPVA